MHFSFFSMKNDSPLMKPNNRKVIFVLMQTIFHSFFITDNLLEAFRRCCRGCVIIYPHYHHRHHHGLNIVQILAIWLQYGVVFTHLYSRRLEARVFIRWEEIPFRGMTGKSTSFWSEWFYAHCDSSFSLYPILIQVT